MSITVAFFDSVQELRNYIDRSVSETKTILGTTFAKTEEIRKRYEASQATPGSEGIDRRGKKVEPTATKQKEVAGFRILVNPTPEYELKLIEESVASLQEKIDMFEKTKELYSSLDKQNAKVAMVLDEGIPTGFMFFGPDL